MADQSGSVALLVISGGFLAGVVVAYPSGGIMTATLIGLGAAAVAGVGLAAFRLRRSRLLAASPEPSVEGLTPQQALAAISAATAAARGVPLRSEVLSALQRIEAERPDPASARSELERLQEDHPRNPAIAAALARARRADGDEAEAARDESRAIVLALHGGMNPTAAALFLESPNRDGLELDSEQWKRLSLALEARDEAEAAAYCRNRAQKASP